MSRLLNDYGRPMPLHNAVISGNLNVVKQLVEAGADIDGQDFRRATPLQYCRAPGRIAGKFPVFYRLFLVWFLKALYLLQMSLRLWYRFNINGRQTIRVSLEHGSNTCVTTFEHMAALPG
jgi:ankyrin repeat protein